MVGDLKVERLVGFLRRNHRPFMNRHLNHEPPSPPHSHGPRGPHAPPSAIGPLRRRRPLLLQPPQRLYRPGAAPVRRKATTPQLVLGCRRRLRPVSLRMRRRRWHGLFRRRRCLYDANTRRSRRFVGRVHVWVVAHDVRVRRPSTHNTTVPRMPVPLGICIRDATTEKRKQITEKGGRVALAVGVSPSPKKRSRA